MRKRTIWEHDIDDGPTVELEHEPNSDSIVVQRMKDRWFVGYITRDEDCGGVEDLMGDCMGVMYSAHRWSDSKDEMQRALGLNCYWEPDVDRFEDDAEHLVAMELYGLPYRTYQDEEAMHAHEDFSQLIFDEAVTAKLKELWRNSLDLDVVLLDCYEHGGQHWSISGDGMQCWWDTSRSAGVWVPDEPLRDQLNDDEKAGKDRRAQAHIYAQQFLDTYNAIISGDVWGAVLQWHDLDGEPIDDESCWGIVGSDYAREEVRTQVFGAAKRYEEDYAEEVRTQNGQQLEMELAA